MEKNKEEASLKWEGIAAAAHLDGNALSMRDRAVIDALPVAEARKEVLTVGAGSGNLDRHIAQAGYRVISTDFASNASQLAERAELNQDLDWHNADIFDLSSFPAEGCETVICCEVLEHLEDWQTALQNLMKLTYRRLIVTVPWWKSYDMPGEPPIGHCNYWTDDALDPDRSLVSGEEYRPIKEFQSMVWPYHANITKIVTKGEDWVTSSRCYLIVIDKSQVADYVLKLSQLRVIPDVVRHVETGEYHLEPVRIPLDTPFASPQRVGPMPEGYWPPALMAVHNLPPPESIAAGPEEEQARWYGAELQNYVGAFEDGGIRVNHWNLAHHPLDKEALSTMLPYNAQRLGITKFLFTTAKDVDLSTLLTSTRKIHEHMWFYLSGEQYDEVAKACEATKINVVNKDWVEFENLAGAIREKMIEK